jgi:hypothetical protein
MGQNILNAIRYYVETLITLNIGYDNKIIDKVAFTWPATCHSVSSVLGSVASFT